MSTDVLLAAAIAFAVAGMLHLWFARDEIYLNWLLPVALLGMFAAYIAINEAIARAALAGLVTGGLVFGLRSLRLYRDHRDRLERFAGELGLCFSKDDQTYAGLGLRLADDRGRCVNVVSGTWRGIRVAAFTYRYADISEDPAIIEITCATTTIDRALPSMLIEPLGAKEYLRRRLGETNPNAFDRRFQIYAPDTDAARAALPLRTREWMLQHAKNGRLVVDGDRIGLTVGRSRMRQIPDVLDRIVALRSTFH